MLDFEGYKQLINIQNSSDIYEKFFHNSYDYYHLKYINENNFIDSEQTNYNNVVRFSDGRTQDIYTDTEIQKFKDKNLKEFNINIFNSEDEKKKLNMSLPVLFKLYDGLIAQELNYKIDEFEKGFLFLSTHMDLDNIPIQNFEQKKYQKRKKYKHSTKYNQLFKVFDIKIINYKHYSKNDISQILIGLINGGIIYNFNSKYRFTQYSNQNFSRVYYVEKGKIKKIFNGIFTETEGKKIKKIKQNNKQTLRKNRKSKRAEKQYRKEKKLLRDNIFKNINNEVKELADKDYDAKKDLLLKRNIKNPEKDLKLEVLKVNPTTLRASNKLCRISSDFDKKNNYTSKLEKFVHENSTIGTTCKYDLTASCGLITAIINKKKIADEIGTKRFVQSEKELISPQNKLDIYKNLTIELLSQTQPKGNNKEKIDFFYNNREELKKYGNIIYHIKNKQQFITKYLGQIYTYPRIKLLQKINNPNKIAKYYITHYNYENELKVFFKLFNINKQTLKNTKQLIYKLQLIYYQTQNNYKQICGTPQPKYIFLLENIIMTKISTELTKQGIRNYTKYDCICVETNNIIPHNEITLIIESLYKQYSVLLIDYGEQTIAA